MPAKIVIYRDGVGGPSYHEKVIRHEIKDVIAKVESHSLNWKPQVIYNFIDEETNTRFVQKN